MRALLKIRSTLVLFSFTRVLYGALVVLLFLSSTISKAQTIESIEYYIGADPGLGNGTIVAATANTGELTQSIVISSVGLESGFNTISLRSKDINGTWGLYKTATFFISDSTGGSELISNLQGAEYWFDTDPGLGLGTALAISGNPSETTESFVIPLGDLEVGFHRLGLRVQNLAGEWSLYDQNTFYISANTGGSELISNLQGAEYWFDSDPGPGGGTALAISGNPSETIESFLIPLGDLEVGFHRLGLRVQNLDGDWSLYDQNTFYISANTGGSELISNLQGAEYWFDSDPGPGGGTALAISGNPSETTESFLIPLGDLEVGFHRVGLRVQNLDGEWSLYDQNTFYVSEPFSGSGTSSNLTAVEYYFDTDPGLGNGTSIALSGNASETLESLVIPVGSLEGGYHQLVLRAQNEAGAWGIYDSKTFYVIDNSKFETGPLEQLIGVEFLFDAELGYGTGTVVPLIPTGNSDEYTIEIPTTDESCNIHSISLALKNAGGDYSQPKLLENIDITDAADPTIVVFENITVELDELGQGSLTIDGVNNGTYDDCELVSVVLDQEVYNYTTANIGSDNMVTVTATDASNKESTLEVTITVIGNGTEPTVWYLDADSDNYAISTLTQEADPGVGYTATVLPLGDCDDTPGDGASIYPGAPEIVDNGIDEDCDGLDLKTWFEDADGDTFGNIGSTTTANVQPSGYVSDSSDCDDTIGSGASIYPGAPETVDNGVDEDCDGFDLQTWYADADGDGYGDVAVSQTANTQPTDYVLDNSDCDDTIGDGASIYPGATEITDNGIDENCDGFDLQTWYADADGDGFGDDAVSQTANTQPEGYVLDNTDCDDSPIKGALIYPGAPETVDNGVDEDCDGFDLQTWYADADGDGYGDDAVSQTSNTQPTDYVLDNSDCDDTIGDGASIYPGATEIPDNGIDEDCDGFDLQTWYADADGDGYGDVAVSQTSNTQPEGYVLDSSDCDDTIGLGASIYPGAPEIVDNGVDEDCDGFDLQTWYVDADGDGYGNDAVSQTANTQPTGYVLDNSDCDDTIGDGATIYPGATEIPDNGIDEDCDGFDLQTWYADADGDGYGNDAVSQTANTQPTGYVLNSTDCDDDNFNVNPSKNEVLNNGIDDDCNPETSDIEVITPVSNLQGAEYWFDTDPGLGLGTALAISGNPSETTESFVIPLGDLEVGFHRLGLRVQNLAGEWSLYDQNTFYISANTGGSELISNLQGAEYWFDSDPGPGGGTALAISGNPSETIESFLIPLGDLEVGFHRLGLRVQNLDGDWSLYDQNTFYISANTGGSELISNLQGAEYWFDSDPGPGGGTALAISGNPSETTESFLIPLGDLEVGFHRVGLRVQNLDGEWSLYDQNTFYVSEPFSGSGTSSNLTAVEYYFDTDPGLGNGTSIALSGNASETLESLVIPVGSLEGGYHQLVLRAQNEAGAWGIYDSKTFYVIDNSKFETGPLEQLIGVEFLFDAELGYGTGTVVPLIPTGNSDEYTIEIPTTDESCNIHSISLALKNAGGDYSQPKLLENIDITDAADPTIVVFENITVELDELGQGSLTIDGVNNGTYDDCELVSVVLDQEVYNYTTANIGSDNMVTVTATDASNKESTLEVTITVIGNGTEPTVWYLDADSDNYAISTLTQEADPGVGYTATVLPLGDCDDTPGDGASIYPGAPEIVDNGIDEDCDGLDLKTWFEDADGDTFGNIGSTTTANVQPSGYVSDSSDCDDTIGSGASIYPGAPETVDNGVDEDCDGFDLQTWYADADGDGYGDVAVSQTANTQPTDYVLDNSDCDDSPIKGALIYPGAPETVDNGVDENCDGFDLQTWYADADGDGYGDDAVSETANTQPEGYVLDNTDCDDTPVDGASINPGATEELNNGIDDDCNPATLDEAVDTVLIPDPNFEQALIDLGIDGNIGDPINGFILKSDAEAVVELNVNNRGINDLTGIEAFTNLSVLYCQYNQLQDLNVTNNAALTILECEGNELTELNVTQNPLLRVLGFGPNNLTEIDVSQNLLLEAIWTNGNNLSSINLDANTKLVVYGLSNNPYKYVSLKNGNNVNVHYFEANSTQSLDCINSDAVVSAQMSSSGKTFSEDCSTSITGRWIMKPDAGSLQVGGGPGSEPIFFSISDEQVIQRSCYYDDVYEFEADGSFKNIVGDATYLEPFQGVPEGCGTPVSPHNGSIEATYTYDQLLGKITLNGLGAYLGIPKVYNEATLDEPFEAIPSDSVTYDVSFSDNGNSMTIEILSEGFLYWTFELVKEAVFIPDANFEQALIDLNIDSDGIINKRILRSDAENTLEINARFPTTPWGSVNSFADPRLTITEKIEDLTGIEAFINLDLLALEHNALTSIDVSNNTQLKDLIIGGNSISTLDLELNSLLEYLNCNFNPIASLDVSLNPNLRELSLDNLLITDIDLSNNPNLESFWASNMTNLTRIEFSSNPLLRNVLINGSKLETLNLSNNPSLSYLAIRDNAFLAHLDIRNGNNSNLGLDVVNTPSLTCINADGSGLPEINQGMVNSGKTFSEDCGDFVYIPDPNFEQALIDLEIDSDGVINQSILRTDAENATEIIANFPIIQDQNGEDIPNPFADPRVTITTKIEDLTGIEAFINLTKFGAGYQDLTSVNLSHNTLLYEAFLNDNRLSSIDISKNTLLTRFGVMRNPNIGVVDVSKNTLLKELFLENTGITTIDLTNNLDLWKIRLENNNLTCLNISNNINLEELRCQNNNLTGLDASFNTKLTDINVRYNAPLTYLNLKNGNNKHVIRFDIRDTALTCITADGDYVSISESDSGVSQLMFNYSGGLLSIDCGTVYIPDANFELALIDLGVDVSGVQDHLILRSEAESTTDLNLAYPPFNPNLPNVNEKIIDLTGIEAFTSLQSLNAKSNDITELDVSNNLALKYLYFGGNELTIIDVSNNTALEYLDVLNNDLSMLDVSQNTLIKTLAASYNNLTSIDVSNNINATWFELNNNNLTSIDVSNNAQLEILNLQDNQLEDIVFGNHNSLKQIVIRNNNLSEIDVSNFSSLEIFFANINLFTELDLSSNTKLIQINVSNNLLASLNVQNGSNINIIYFPAVNNPDLSCIQVDSGIAGTLPADWTKDDFAIYSSDCSIKPEHVYIPDPNFEQALIDLDIDSDGVVNSYILRSDAEAVTDLNISSKGISVLTGLEAFINIETLNCFNNQIQEIELYSLSKLSTLDCRRNQLNEINTVNNEQLSIFYFSNNAVSEIDVSSNINLTRIAGSFNPISTLDLSTNKELTYISFVLAPITKIDLSKNEKLTVFFALYTDLISVDLSNNPLLSQINVDNNANLKHLDLRNGNNDNILSFSASNTLELTCINVDDENASYLSNWNVDEGDIFSKDCGDFVYITDPNFEQSLIDIGFDSDGVVNASILRSDAEDPTKPTLNLNNSLFTPEWYDFNNPAIVNVTGKIEDLTGIEAFINLTNLQISYSDLSTIDVSNNTLLEELWVTDGILTGIDVSSNTNLIQLGVSANNITGTVDVSENTALELLFIGINPINSLDVTSNTSLSYLWVPGTQITSLDISLNPNLQRLDAQYNPGFSLITDPAGYPAMTSLNLSGIGLSNYNLYAPLFPNLQWLLLNDNSLTRFNGNNALLVENLFLNNNSIDKLVLSSNTALKQLHANNNVLTELDVKNGNNLALQTLNVTENLLTCINVDDPLDGSMPYALWNTDLGVVLSDNCSAEPEIVLIPDPIFEQKLIDEGIDLDGIGLNGSLLLSDALATTQLDVYLSGITDMTGIEAFENLETLNASHNNFNEIDLTNCTNLVSIDLSFNNLTTLNVTSGRVLTLLYLGGNNLTTLNLGELTNLTNVDLSFNNFESIDASGLDQLLEFSIHNNNLSTLDMRNGNNAAMVNFSAENNQNLACIGVDDPISISETIWKINGSTVFSSNSDCVAPTVVTKDFTIFLDNKGKATAVASQFDNGSTDNITANANLVFSLNKTDFNCSDFGSNVVELSVTDEAGNVGIGYANVIVNDAIPPIAKAVREYAFDLAGGNTTLDASILNNGSTDNCSIASFSLSQSYFTLPGIYYVDFIAHDIGGNEGKTQVKLTVSDSENSEILTVGNVTVTVYPNPFQDYISLKFSKNMDFSTVNVSLTDFNGNPTGAAFAVQDATNLKTTGLSGLAPGSYILTVSKGRKSDTAIMMKD